MATETKFIYRVHRVPTNDPVLLGYLAGKFTALRLNALQLDKASFSSTFELESTWSAAFWLSRLVPKNINTFIAIGYAAETPVEKQTVDRGELVGSATLIGPMPKQEYFWPESGGPVIGEDEEENKWHICSVYNSPVHRRRGVGRLLINASFAFAQEQADGKKTRVRVNVAPGNNTAVMLYASLGYVDAGRCTREEAYVSNGDEEFLPPPDQKDPERWSTRSGIVMEKTLN